MLTAVCTTSIMRSMRQQKPKKTRIINMRADQRLKQAVAEKCDLNELSMSGAITGLLKAWLSGEVEYNGYQFVKGE